MTLQGSSSFPSFVLPTLKVNSVVPPFPMELCVEDKHMGNMHACDVEVLGGALSDVAKAGTSSAVGKQEIIVSSE